MQQADGNRLNPISDQRLNRAAQRIFIQYRHHLTPGIYALWHNVAPFTRYGWMVLLRDFLSNRVS